MSSTIKRFEKGVHRSGECGKNKQGFSSINSLDSLTNFHILNSMNMNYNISELKSVNKIKMGSSDTLAYILAKVFEQVDAFDTYVLLLRKDTVLSGTLESMIISCSMESKFILTVIPVGDKYTIRSYFKGVKTTISVDAAVKFRKTIVSMNAGRSSIYIVYPEMSEAYKNLLNSLKDCTWCITASSSVVHVSTQGRESYDHFAFPWSTCSSCKGYTIGYGTIRPAFNREKVLYMGSFAYYSKMISGVRYKNSCPDCYEMMRTAISIKRLTKVGSCIGAINMEEYDRRSSIASAVYITVLEEMKNIIASHSG